MAEAETGQMIVPVGMSCCIVCLLTVGTDWAAAFMGLELNATGSAVGAGDSVISVQLWC